MKHYTNIRGSQPEKPPEIDTQSSPTTVYIRENIRREGDFWVYDETQYTTQEFIQLQSRQISLLEQVKAKMIQAASPALLSARSSKQESFAKLAERFLKE